MVRSKNRTVRSKRIRHKNMEATNRNSDRSALATASLAPPVVAAENPSKESQADKENRKPQSIARIIVTPDQYVGSREDNTKKGQALTKPFNPNAIERSSINNTNPQGASAVIPRKSSRYVFLEGSIPRWVVLVPSTGRALEEHFTAGADPPVVLQVPTDRDLVLEAINISTISASSSSHSLEDPMSDLSLGSEYELPSSLEGSKEGPYRLQKKDGIKRTHTSTHNDVRGNQPCSHLNPHAPSFSPGTNTGTRTDSSAVETKSQQVVTPRRHFTAQAFARRTLKYQRVRDHLNGGEPHMQIPPSPRLVFPPRWVSPASWFMSPQARIEPKITMIDEQLKIFVVDLISEDECDWILHSAEEFAEYAATWRREAWRKLYTYTHCDLPCCEVITLRDITNRLIYQIRRSVGRVYSAPWAATRLVPRSWKEPHLLRYQKIVGETSHTGMGMHFDGGHLTWQLMLSQQQVDYTGGGTYFSSIRKTIVLKKGQALVHPGDLYHRGVDITAGIRTLMLCFMDGFDPKIEDPGEWREDSSEFEKHVISV